MEIIELEKFFKKNKAKANQDSLPLIDELTKRLHNLVQVGLGYLTLGRSSETLSGGEAQRIRLGVQFDSFLSGVLYVLDEPTIGLHTRDTIKVINAFKRLKKEGNTVIIVEHDRLVLENADYIFDIGPGAGNEGGRLIASGTPSAIKKNKNSVTGKYLAHKKTIPCRKIRRKPNNGKLEVIGAKHNNLKNINVKIPLGNFICVTGVSGSGKSSLVYDVIAKSLARQYHKSEKEVGEHERIEGTENLDKVIKIDQSPIGRTPRSNLATYTGIFTSIRDLFASTAESKLRGFSASRFSFNLRGGRCEACRGDGFIKIEMYFMPDVYTKCEECDGSRYNKETLEIKYKEKNISEVLEMTVDGAFDFFKNSQEIHDKLMILRKVGLGYLSLGQSATTLSGGEAQRVKLATELSRPSTGKTIYILDEPTTGLHFEDISRLLVVLQELVDRGNTVVVIEHNLDVIKNADYIIDMGPGGGDEGGYIIAEGSPEKISLNKKSTTGKYLAEILRHP
jgi:excinuclease ABC subunit A